MTDIKFETNRLILRSWRDEDLECLVPLGEDPEVMEFLAGVVDADGKVRKGLMSRASNEMLLGRLQERERETGLTFWAVERKDTGGFAGFLGLAEVRFECHFKGGVEIGWRLARDAWGLGFASEGARACADYAFDVLGLEEIVSLTVPKNVRSRRVMEKLGMTHDPRDDFDHPAVADDDPLKRHVLYRLKRDDWEGRKLSNG